MKVSNLLARTITGVIYIAIILSGILSDSVMIVGMVFAIFAGQANFELQSIIGINRKRLMLKIVHALMTILLFYVIFTSSMQDVSYRDFLILLLPYLAYYLFYLTAELYRNRQNPIYEVGLAFFSHLYIAIPLGMLMLLCVDKGTTSGLDLGSMSFHRTFWLLPIFVFVWLNDTGAYLVGSKFGKHKLFERISPKKTFEGFAGGILFTLLGAVAFYYIFPEVTSVFYWLILALLVGVFSTWGDLFESFIKRTYGVKDSGNILPGHGGILDRIDSILFAAIPAFMFIEIIVYLK
ncbi:phosphatidate cytidylyltransferase [Porphyromonas sp.]|uniref:phosphatidate cytidylyltransferase n=1 Tax=Porphyromonas sp. TaxID=1924944 RepID=UPI0026DBAEF9|nr:phosphatidate cytidylyltransferase [Porphyromonas sp.]MDO4695168.1 phosphatidate cytidylyltransferase [Porphyromonas sp.]MDO4770914.1 phosphatidate cytidylyltransferase [Porphyromonas sp.]